MSLIGHYNIILGMPQVRAQDVYINGPRSEMKIITINIIIRSKEAFYELKESIGQAVNVSAASFQFLRTRKEKTKSVQTDQKKIIVFTISIVDINKALAIKKYIDSKNKMLIYFY